VSRQAAGKCVIVLDIVERGAHFHKLPLFVDLQVLTHVAERLQDLHSAGYVHRDIKPGNVMWLPRQKKWTVIDFGCVARTGESCRTGFSLFYAAPEVVRGYYRDKEENIEADPALDAWSLGVMAIEMFTGNPAFDLTQPKQTVRAAASNLLLRRCVAASRAACTITHARCAKTGREHSNRRSAVLVCRTVQLQLQCACGTVCRYSAFALRIHFRFCVADNRDDSWRAACVMGGGGDCIRDAETTRVFPTASARPAESRRLEAPEHQRVAPEHQKSSRRVLAHSHESDGASSNQEI
jgi:serine/threonine protein kinase